MKAKFRALGALAISLVLAGALTGCPGGGHDDHDHGHGHGHDHDEADEFARGPHNGRLLRDGDFSVELKIFETGVPPQYRIYGFENDEALAPKDFTATVTLDRLGSKSETFSFAPAGDFLVGDKEVREPHSFAVRVDAGYKGKKYSWRFESYEGRTSLTDEVARLSGVKTEQVRARVIRSVAKVRGKIFPSEERIGHVIPRFSGVVREGRKHIGDKVEKGEVVAIIESNQSLQPFEVRSQISGTVVNGHVVVGEFVPENQWIYVIADLSEVWADFFVPLGEKLTISNGQKIEISSVSGDQRASGTVSYAAPYADEKSQSQLVRAVIPNPGSLFLPGMFITGEVVMSEREAPAAIRQSALQTFRDWRVAFVKSGETYEVRPLELGRSDGEWVEVLEGLTPGDEYVTENAFLIKADILKSGATHDH